MENKSNKTVWWVIGIIVVVGLVWWGMSKQSASGDTIKIGVIGPFTGDAAVYGEPFRNVANLAVGEINGQGGINGKQIQMIYEDGKCTGQDGANAAQKLVNVDGVQIILGGFCSGETIPAIPIAAQGKVLMFSPSASSPDLTGISPYFFRDYPSDATEGKVLADAAYNMKRWRSVAIIQEQTDYATGNYKSFSQEFQSLGGKIINQSFPTVTTDFRSILTTLKSSKPDALFVDSQTPQAAARILKQLQELGWKLPLLVNDATGGDPQTLKTNAAQLEGTLTAEFGVDPSNPKFQHLINAYKTQYGSDVPYQSYMQTVYDSIYLLRDGITKVGYNGAALAAWSRTIKDWQGASGAITIEANGDRASGHRLEIIHNGVAEPVQQ